MSITLPLEGLKRTVALPFFLPPSLIVADKSLTKEIMELSSFWPGHLDVWWLDKICWCPERFSIITCDAKGTSLNDLEEDLSATKAEHMNFYEGVIKSFYWRNLSKVCIFPDYICLNLEAPSVKMAARCYSISVTIYSVYLAGKTDSHVLIGNRVWSSKTKA